MFEFDTNDWPEAMFGLVFLSCIVLAILIGIGLVPLPIYATVAPAGLLVAFFLLWMVYGLAGAACIMVWAGIRAVIHVVGAIASHISLRKDHDHE